MVKQLSPKDKVEELFKSIENSNEYQSYLEISKALEKNEEIKDLVNLIKRLQQKSVQLEYNNDPTYKDVDKEIEKKVAKLNSIPIYQEYLRRMNDFNDILSESSSNMEKYINSKI